MTHSIPRLSFLKPNRISGWRNVTCGFHTRHPLPGPPAGRTAPRVDPAHLSYALDNSVDLFLLDAVLLPGPVGFLDPVLQLLDGHEVLIRNHLPKRFFDRPRTGKD